ncbi:hypothetical protein PGH12_06800 [Chryseobacterium wangxinyae]|uniref:hypothetical protein n=1 Tax=Chryseobacterium sp. CY350 TaxID=2997336 RepID=UPI00226F3623|nr:hypothetical protein [Chryseobacterium sp. CY350]MCY0976859.1 hypothetical protein [Chryseobacterium sp. CY350]WBZ96858.1 hypothetical protein PGH12_06800 [Chryseobacterium sp. CY350]
MKTNPHISVQRTSGQSCPTSGTWQCMGSFVTTITIAKGSKLPDYCGIQVRWILISIN